MPVPAFDFSGQELRDYLVETEFASGSGIRPESIAGEAPMRTFPVDASGLPQTNLNNFPLAAQYDFTTAIWSAFFEAAKTRRSVLLDGGYRVTSWIPLQLGPGNGMIGRNPQQAQIFYDGLVNTDFIVSGLSTPPEIAIPISAVETISGRTRVTLAVPGVAGAPAAKVRRADQAASGAAWLDVSGAWGYADPWGQWLLYELDTSSGGTTRSANLRNATTGFQRLAVYSADVAARQVTFTTVTTVGTPTWITFPALNATTQAVSDNDTFPHYRYGQASGILFHGRDKGVVTIFDEGAAGLRDPQTRWNRVIFSYMYSGSFDLDSDTTVDDLVCGGWVGDGPTIDAVDTTIDGLQVAATQGRGVIWRLGNSKVTGRMKSYYTSQGGNWTAYPAVPSSDGPMFAHDFPSNVSSMDFSGPFVVEDSAGIIRLANNCRNLRWSAFEGSNAGAMSLGAPGTLGLGNWWPADVLWVDRNASLADIYMKGVCRANRGSRDGWHVRSSFWIDRADTNVWASAPSHDNRYLVRNMHVDLDMIEMGVATSMYVPGNEIPATVVPTWSAGKADYLTSDIVSLNGTATEIRWIPKVNNPTVGVSPPNNLTQWKWNGGGRTAWEGAFRVPQTVNEAIRRQFINCEFLTNGKRDPSYHQRELLAIASYLVDWQHDLVRCNMTSAAAAMVLDVAPGDERKEQIFRAYATGIANGASLAQVVQITPGARGWGAPWQAGSVGTLRRGGQECKVVHRSGLMHYLPHEQVEVLPLAATTLTVDIADYGHRICHIGSSTLTVTFPSQAVLPEGWYVDFVQFGSGVIDFGSMNNGVLATSGAYTEARVTKANSILFAA